MAKKKSKLTEEERLIKKREAEKKRYAKIKSDPVAFQLQKEKERLKYLKKKEKGIVKPAVKMTPRELRLKRKQWKENSKGYRKRIKDSQKVQQILQDDSPPTSDSDTQLPGPSNRQVLPDSSCTPSTSAKDNNLVTVSRKLSGRKRVRRDRSALFRKLTKAEEKIKNLNKKVERYKKRYQRLHHKSEGNPDDLTPNSKVNYYLRKPEKFSAVIKKKLVFGEVLSNQLSSSYAQQKSDKERQAYHKILSGKILKKYKLLNTSKQFFKYKRFVANTNRQLSCLLYERKNRADVVNDEIKLNVQKFLEEDNNSIMCPGKKDCITQHAIKKQKRYLCDNLKNLHKQYIKTNKYISYPTFCRLRPFWVVQRKISDRDTCKCLKHENMALILKELHLLNVVTAKTPRDLLMELCCSKSSTRCLLKNCEECKNRVVTLAEFDMSRNVTYKQWLNKKHEYFDKKSGRVKFTKKTIKEDINCSLQDLVEVLKKSQDTFLLHEGIRVHQHEAITELKKTLQTNEIIVHVDFSENYQCKYESEIQSFHFGGSRLQVSLHTVVAYFMDLPNELCTSNSFCTVSENLHHGPGAIWTHLQPVLSDLFERFPNTDTLHMYSDSPSSQYRNKAMFSYLATKLPKNFPKLVTTTWNYSAPGHGKGAPDGIGGVLKRTADNIVSQGKDVPNCQTLVQLLKDSCPGVKLFNISNEEITENILVIEKEGVPFKGTMKVHQVFWNKYHPPIEFRNLSCFDCLSSRCTHYYMGEVNLQFPKENENNILSPQNILKKTHTDDTSSNKDEITTLQPGDWVVVSYDQENYPGEVLAVTDQFCEVSVMVPATGTAFKWPNKKDILQYPYNDIIKKIGPPEPCGNRASQFLFKDFVFN